MKKLFEALRLLTLPISAAEDEKGGMDLHNVEEEVFASNERARDVLERLDVLLLSGTEARNILPRRIDLAG